MSAAIRTSLNRLHSAVQKLEGAVETKKASLAAAHGAAKKGNPNQNDLFGAMTAGQPSATSNANALNVRMLATRLDNAIEQVEQILKEGRG